jgi:hypothetical protein
VLTRASAQPVLTSRPPPKDDGLTRPGVMPVLPETTPPAANAFSAQEGTAPARPRALRAPTNGVPVSQPPLKQFDYDEDDDDAGDKTIPAAALPAEIKSLREQFLAARKNGAPPAATPPAQELTPAAPQRSVTSETISITNKGNPMDWEDDDGAKTAIARPGELPGQAIARLTGSRRPVAPAPNDVSAAALEPVQDEYDSSEDLPPLPRQSRGGLIIAFVVLALLAVLGLLVLLDVIPMPGMSTSSLSPRGGEGWGEG